MIVLPKHNYNQNYHQKTFTQKPLATVSIKEFILKRVSYGKQLVQLMCKIDSLHLNILRHKSGNMF